MQYLHIKNLDKYHPSYKDRSLIWCKAYFSMLNSDPEFELLCEIDKWRFIAFIMLELQLKKPIPLDNIYLARKGFNLKNRPISLTLQMLHTLVEVRNADVTQSRVEYNRIEKSRIEENCISPIVNKLWITLWDKYPKKIGKRNAEKHFINSVKTEQDCKDITTALDHYLKSERVFKGYIQNADTWFNNWRDWIDFKEEICLKCKNTGKYTSVTGYESICECPVGRRLK